MPRRAPPPVAAGAAVLLWSTNAWAAGEVLATRTTVLQLLTVQFGSAAAVLLVARCLLRRPASPPAGARSVAVGVIGLTGTVFLQYLAFDTAPLVGANVLCYADGLLAALWVAARRPSRHTLVGVPLALVGFAGVAVVLAGDSGAGPPAPGYLFALGAAAGMAFYSLSAGRRTVSTLDLLLPATVVGTLLAGALSVLHGEVWPPVADWIGAVYIGVAPMAAGYALWTFAMSDGRADRLVPLCYATPLVSTALLLATGRPATAAVLAGSALVLVCTAGVLLVEWHHGRRAVTPVPDPDGAVDVRADRPRRPDGPGPAP